MKMRFTHLVALVTMIFFMTSHHEAKASWLMGGEITWECTPQGNFRFILKLYRECAHTSTPPSVNLTTNVPGFSTIQLNRVSMSDLSPTCSCPGGPNITCAGTTWGNSNTGAIEESIYTSDMSFPGGVPLTGVPPATGWYFAYNFCCRPPNSNIPGSYISSTFLRAIMFPYQGTPVNTCFDNSPRFMASPSSVICSGYPFAYNYLASDEELDSLVYSWAQPLNNSISNPLTPYASGYSFDSPLPGPTHHPNNVAATINPHSGEITITSYTNGAFLTVVKVTAYKSGIKVAEIYRELQVALLDCGSNTPPSVTAPFQDSLGQYTVYQDTVYAGDTVGFNISASSFQYCGDTTTPLTFSLHAYGAQFGAPINPGGCLNPPCAALTPSPTNTTPLTSTYGVQTTFHWQTGSQHLVHNIGHSLASTTYNFLFKMTDNFCPLPGTRYATVTIVVLERPIIPSPAIECVEVQPNGDVLLSWTEAADTMNLFNSYHVWYATSAEGPFSVIDSIFDITIDQYLHAGAAADIQQGFYRLTIRCDKPTGAVMMPNIATVKTIALKANYPGQQGASFTLKWNDPVQPIKSAGSQRYEVWRKIGSGNWTMLVQITDTLWHDMQLLCSDTVAYRIELTDTANPAACRSISNWVSGFFENTIPPQEPTPHLVTVDETSGQSHFSWLTAKDEDAAGYLVTTHQGGVLLATDTLWNLNDTSWTDLLHDPCSGAITYHVHTFDICGNVSAPSQAHNTIFPTVQYDAAQNANHIAWNPYTIVSGAGSGYSVWYSVNGGTPVYLATVSPQVTQCIHPSLTGGDTICYTVMAYGAAQQLWSRSCEVCTDVPTQVTREEPLLFSVGQNIPNPATGQTFIPFSVPVAGKVELVVRHLTGQTLRHEEMIAQPGKNHFTLHAGDLPQGVYLYSIQYQGAVQTRKMTVW